MLENSERSVCGVRMGKSGPLERTELANQIQGFRIPDRWDASEKNKCYVIINVKNIYITIVNNVSDVNYFSIADNVSIVKYLDLPIKKKYLQEKKKKTNWVGYGYSLELVPNVKEE